MVTGIANHGDRDREVLQRRCTGTSEVLVICVRCNRMRPSIFRHHFVKVVAVACRGAGTTWSMCWHYLTKVVTPGCGTAGTG